MERKLIAEVDLDPGVEHSHVATFGVSVWRFNQHTLSIADDFDELVVLDLDEAYALYEFLAHLNWGEYQDA